MGSTQLRSHSIPMPTPPHPHPVPPLEREGPAKWHGTEVAKRKTAPPPISKNQTPESSPAGLSLGFPQGPRLAAFLHPFRQCQSSWAQAVRLLLNAVLRTGPPAVVPMRLLVPGDRATELQWRRSLGRAAVLAA